jgi:hypothetical protein
MLGLAGRTVNDLLLSIAPPGLSLMKFKVGHLFRNAHFSVSPPAEKPEIVISSNCQIGGFLAALKCIFPNRNIGIQPFPKSGDMDGAELFRRTLEGARVWITTDRLELRGDLPIEIIRIPDLNFNAFHPDMRVAINVTTNMLAARPNNSQIAVWAYNNQISKRDTVKLFNRDVFQSLGYLDCWTQSVAALRTRFGNAGIGAEDFERFFLCVKRMGQFMHTFNHPRIEALVELARIVARRLGADSERVEGDIVVPDALTYALWPLYPEIGEALGLRGNYHWRITATHTFFDLYGIEAYLDFAYQSFAEQGIHPTEVECRSPTSNLDEILREQVNSR